MADEQDLNSVDRFRKHSKRLVLEQYTHCEVPAGCGGVVFRWHNPSAKINFKLYLYTIAPGDFFLDGDPLAMGGMDASPGSHVLALKLPNVERNAGILMVAARSRTSLPIMKNVSDFDPNQPRDCQTILSVADGTWKYTLDPPVDEKWKLPYFEEENWFEMVEFPIPNQSFGSHSGYQMQRCQEWGARLLGSPAPRPKLWPLRLTKPADVWIRKCFTVSSTNDS